MLAPALDWHERAGCAAAALVRGDELAREPRHRPGAASRRRLIAELAEAQYAGEIATREDAVSFARDAARSPR
jgi:hypothetical protein